MKVDVISLVWPHRPAAPASSEEISVRRTATATLALAAALALTLSACGSDSNDAEPAAADASASASTVSTENPIAVVASANFWGSLADQLGGDRVEVTSIIDDPAIDAHDYEPTAKDGRALASADYVVINGLDYDHWAGDLVEANPVDDRTVMTVGDVVGAEEGDNPHRWYSPKDVNTVIEQITEDLSEIEPENAAYFEERRTAFVEDELAGYTAAIEEINEKYEGTEVGASESIFALLAPELGLELITPEGFIDAASEGLDPSAADKAKADAQVRDKKIAVYVFNEQNVGPDVQAQVDAAEEAGIPVVTVTETLNPSGATFQEWQTTQLEALAAALESAGAE
jgi:zinc/manganese transport system substrate-binding protein